MNIAEATTEIEIARFIVETGRDAVGTYHILTEYEGTGGCFWCGLELEGRQRRFCKGREHWRLYWQHFNWSFARSWCLERYGYRCANCGTTSLHWEDGHLVGSDLEAHHIIPLEGGERAWTPYNLPWNLICLCHECHLEVQGIMRVANRRLAPDIFERAKERGQLTFAELIENVPENNSVLPSPVG